MYPLFGLVFTKHLLGMYLALYPEISTIIFISRKMKLMLRGLRDLFKDTQYYG